MPNIRKPNLPNLNLGEKIGDIRWKLSGVWWKLDNSYYNSEQFEENVADKLRVGIRLARKVGYGAMVVGSAGLVAAARWGAGEVIRQKANDSRSPNGKLSWTLNYADQVEAQAQRMAAAGDTRSAKALYKTAEQWRRDAEPGTVARIAMGVVAIIGGETDRYVAHLDTVDAKVDESRYGSAPTSPLP